MKCDNEPAIKQALTESITKMKVDVEDLEAIGREHPERYESQSNGMIEVGVKNFRGHFRTLWSCIQRRLEVEIPINHPVAAWLSEHVCILMNTMVRGGDGLTAWERARGRPFRQRLIGFFESCMYKLPVKGPWLVLGIQSRVQFVHAPLRRGWLHDFACSHEETL